MISDEEWNCYRDAALALREADVPFLLGGGFALAGYTGRSRNAKDMDFYIFEKDRPAAVRALTQVGFEDYFAKKAYDRNWIYRSTRSGVILDVIWAMANQRTQVDQIWFDRATPMTLRDLTFNVVPLEEFIWCKLYIVQRDHCGWIDVFNLLYDVGSRVDWDHLFKRVGEDWPLLKGLLSVYDWLCPSKARKLPEGLRRRLRLEPPVRRTASREKGRARLMDSRGWFAPMLPPNQPLEV